MQKQGLYLQGVLEAILSESDFTVIYLKNKKCTKKKENISIEISSVALFFAIILIIQKNKQLQDQFRKVYENWHKSLLLA